MASIPDVENMKVMNKIRIEDYRRGEKVDKIKVGSSFQNLPSVAWLFKKAKKA